MEEIKQPEQINQEAVNVDKLVDGEMPLPPGVMPEPSFDDIMPENIKKQTPQQDIKTQAEQSVTKTEQLAYNPIWNAIKNKLGDDFKLPDKIVNNEIKTPEEELDLLVDVIINNSTVEPDLSALPPLVQEYLYASSDKNFDEKEWIKSKAEELSMFESDSETFMFNYLKNNFLKTEANPNGKYTLEGIKDMIEKMKNSGVLDITAMNIKKQLEQNSNINQQQNIKPEDRYKRHLEEVKSNIDRDIEEIKAQYRDVEDIAGIKLGKAEISKAIEEFHKAVTPDEKTGIAPIQRMLQSNNILFESFVLTMYRNGELLKEFLNNSKELTKERIFEKLRSNPKTTGNIVFPNTVDPSKLV